MRKAMSEAVVGDDVLGEDPTIARLEETAAEMFNMESGLFVASGTRYECICSPHRVSS